MHTRNEMIAACLNSLQPTGEQQELWARRWSMKVIEEY